MATLPDPETTTTNLLTLLTTHGRGDYIGESINQLEHSLQAAAFGLSQNLSSSISPIPEPTILAALFHDIGQFLPIDAARDVAMEIESGESVGRVGHERIGAEFLKGLGFGEGVWRVVGAHVDAKRYLTATDPAYYAGLSTASKQSLAFQGGPFAGADLAKFEADPLCEEMVRVRRWDDGAKVVGIEDRTPRAEVYRGMIRRHLEAMVEVRKQQVGKQE